MAETKVLSLTAVRHDRAYRKLLTDLESYCLDFEEEELSWAEDLFYGGETTDAADQERWYPSFTDWLAFSYPTCESGLPPAALFAVQRRDSLERDLLAAWCRTRPGFYLVDEVQPDAVLLRDCVTGAVSPVTMEGAPPTPGALMMGRILPVGDGWRTGYDLSELRGLPWEAYAPVLDAELARMRRAWPEAGWDDLLRERWPLLRGLVGLSGLVVKAGKQMGTPPVPATRSRGLTAPPPGAPATWVAVAAALAEYGADGFLAFGERQNLQRLWWDAALTLQPKVVRPKPWAAGVVYAWHHWVTDEEDTRAEVGEAFGVGPSAVGPRARAVAEAVGLEFRDDRYADPLELSVRTQRALDYMAVVR